MRDTAGGERRCSVRQYLTPHLPHLPTTRLTGETPSKGANAFAGTTTAIRRMTTTSDSLRGRMLFEPRNNFRTKIKSHYSLFNRLLNIGSEQTSFGLPTIPTDTGAKFVTLYDKTGPVLVRNEYEDCWTYLHNAYDDWIRTNRVDTVHVIYGQPSSGMSISYPQDIQFTNIFDRQNSIRPTSYMPSHFSKDPYTLCLVQLGLVLFRWKGFMADRQKDHDTKRARQYASRPQERGSGKEREDEDTMDCF